jgi:hypothetical protein
VEIREVVQFMKDVSLLLIELLDWEFSLDNPMRSVEGGVLKGCLIAELRRLERSRRRFYTEELITHMEEVGKAALKIVVIEDKKARLENPLFFLPGTLRIETFCANGRLESAFLLEVGERRLYSSRRVQRTGRAHGG